MNPLLTLGQRKNTQDRIRALQNYVETVLDEHKRGNLPQDWQVTLTMGNKSRVNLLICRSGELQVCTNPAYAGGDDTISFAPYTDGALIVGVVSAANNGAVSAEIKYVIPPPEVSLSRGLVASELTIEGLCSLLNDSLHQIEVLTPEVNTFLTRVVRSFASAQSRQILVAYANTSENLQVVLGRGESLLSLQQKGATFQVVDGEA